MAGHLFCSAPFLRFVGLVRERNRDSGSCFGGQFCGLNIGPRFLPQSNAPNVRGRLLAPSRAPLIGETDRRLALFARSKLRSARTKAICTPPNATRPVRRKVRPWVHQARDAANPSRTSRAISFPNARKRRASIREAHRHISTDDQLMCPPCIRTPRATQSAFCFVSPQLKRWANEGGRKRREALAFIPKVAAIGNSWSSQRPIRPIPTCLTRASLAPRHSALSNGWALLAFRSAVSMFVAADAAPQSY